jgi:TRAP-type mannitol/chloroaromatic compound transport system permease large subunit
MAVLMQTCFMTPPFGFALFFIRGIVPEGVKMTDVYKGVIPFLAIIIAVTVLCCAVPNLVTWLPNAMIS